VVFQATNSGQYLVIVGDNANSWAGTGNYRLTLAKTGSLLDVSAGHDGGPMNGSGVYKASLLVGDLDVWSFTACQGEPISLNVQEAATGSNLTPWIRLYAPNGNQVSSISGLNSATVSVAAPASGTYIVVVSDRSNSFAGSGTYQLTATGLVDDLTFCPLSILGTGFAPTIIGGPPLGTFIVLTSTNVTALIADWTPVLTNQFNQFGTATLTNWVNSTEPHRFFQVRY
jgi:hypothetical protein